MKKLFSTIIFCTLICLQAFSGATFIVLYQDKNDLKDLHVNKYYEFHDLASSRIGNCTKVVSCYNYNDGAFLNNNAEFDLVVNYKTCKPLKRHFRGEKNSWQNVYLKLYKDSVAFIDELPQCVVSGRITDSVGNAPELDYFKVSSTIVLPDGFTTDFTLDTEGVKIDNNGNYSVTVPIGKTRLYCGLSLNGCVFMGDTAIDVNNEHEVCNFKCHSICDIRLQVDSVQSEELKLKSKALITGTVIDGMYGGGLLGANVILKGSKIRCATDFDGNYSMEIPSGDVTIEFSSMGYKTIDKTFFAQPGAKIKIDVVLKEDTKGVDEVVIYTGFPPKEDEDVLMAIDKGMRVKNKSAEKLEAIPETVELSVVEDEELEEVIYVPEKSKTKDVKIRGVASATSYNDMKAGRLTAGEVNDFAKWELWKKLVAADDNILPRKRFVLQLTTDQQIPLPDAVVQLLDNDEVIWQAHTDNSGRAELWAVDTFASSKTYEIKCEYEDSSRRFVAKSFDEGINYLSFDKPCSQLNLAEVMFVIDATGSMGDEIRYLNAEFRDVMSRAKENNSDIQLRTGALFYRDYGDEYLTRISNLGNDIKSTWSFISKQDASGGGDFPEAVPEALTEAIEFGGWSEQALARIIFLVLDAPSHDDVTTLANLNRAVASAAAKGIRVVPIVCSGMDKFGEFQMRTMALSTNGTSFFLTDDSGIGEKHIKPTTDHMDVEKLNDMLVRIIAEYTKMPDCSLADWAEQNVKSEKMEQFLPNPYELSDLNDEDLKTIEPVESELSVSDVMTVAPNPCNTQFRVEFHKNVRDVFLVDMTGKMLQRFDSQSEGATLEISVDGYATGVYFLKAFCGNRWFTHKEVVKGH